MLMSQLLWIHSKINSKCGPLGGMVPSQNHSKSQSNINSLLFFLNLHGAAVNLLLAVLHEQLHQLLANQ